MKYTDKLGLPIWDEPETDLFDIEEFNKGNQAIDDIVIDILKQIDGGSGGDIDFSGTGLTEEQANNIKKIPSIEGIVTSNSQSINSMLNSFDYTFGELELTVLDKWIEANGAESTYNNYLHAEIPNVKSGQVYQIKCRCGSNIRAYV